MSPTPINTRERALIDAAGTLVRDWLFDSRRLPFRQVLLDDADAYLTEYGLAHEDYNDLRLIANAIRVGRGHPTDNPNPLMDLLRKGIRHPTGIGSRDD